MTVPITIPALGESITHGILACWYAEDGQWVEAGQNLYQLETDKISLEGIAEKPGKLHIHIPAGQEVRIHQIIGRIEGKEAPLGTPEVPKPSTSPQVLASSPSTTRVPLSPLRKTIAANLVKAKHQTATTTTFNEVNMEGILHIKKAYQTAFQEKYQVKLGLMSFFVKAATHALQTVPEVNVQLEEDNLVMNHYYAIGIAIGSDKGLVVPVVRNCDQASFADIEGAIRDYSQKAKASKLSLEDLKGGVFSISNGGVYGSLCSTPLLNPPQSAILGMHAIQERVIALKGQIVIRPMMNLALSYDHRVIDGKQATTFLRTIKTYLEDTTEATFKELLGL